MGVMKMKPRAVVLLILSILFVPIPSQAQSIQWQTYKDGLSKGKAEQKRIFLNFYADW
jgi:thiol:disulfide interchange protein